MKKLLLGLTILLSTHAGVFAKANPGPVIKAVLEIGKKGSCMGFGICKFNVSVEWDFIADRNSVLGQLSMKDPNTLVLQIDKKAGISNDAYKNYFASGVFAMEDAFTLDQELLKSLEYKGDFTIPKGKYSIKESKDFITIYFTKN